MKFDTAPAYKSEPFLSRLWELFFFFFNYFFDFFLLLLFAKYRISNKCQSYCYVTERIFN